MDNCSADATLDVLRSYPHLIWRSEPDRGQTEALNRALSCATGDIIGWLNADDCYLPGCFQSVVDAFRAKAETDIVFGDYRWVDAQGRVLRLRKEIDFDLFILKYLHVLYIPTTATFFSRRVIGEGYYLNPAYQYAMDYEWFLRMALAGLEFTHIRRCLADFRMHPLSKTGTAAHRQRAEQERALLELDPTLHRFPALVRMPVRHALMVAARGKRSCKKLLGRVIV